MHALSLLAFLLIAGQTMSQDVDQDTEELILEAYNEGQELAIEYDCGSAAQECVSKVNPDDFSRACKNIKIAANCVHISCPELQGTPDETAFLAQVIKAGKSFGCKLTANDIITYHNGQKATYGSFLASMLMVVTAAVLGKYVA